MTPLGTPVDPLEKMTAARQRRALFLLQQRGKLNQPGGSLRGENLNHRFRPGSADQLPECVQNRVVRFLAPEAFDTLPAGETQIFAAACTLLERIEQRAL